MIRTSLILITSNILLIVWRGNVDAFIWPQMKADIAPIDSLVFIGESIKYRCQVHDGVTDVTSDNISFHIDSHGNNLNWSVPEENITRVDNRTKFAQIDITEDFSKLITISCLATNMIPVTTYLNVERPIQNITNFTVVFYYNTHINLSWSLGETYLDIAYIEVIVDWNANRAPNKGGNLCSNQTLTSCRIDYTGNDYIVARVNVSEKRNRSSEGFVTELYSTTASSMHNFYVDDYRKTSPPLNLRVVDAQSSCITFTWDHPLYFTSCDDCNPIYQLTATNKINASDTINYVDTRNNSQVNVTFCPLTPFTSYTMSVKIKAEDKNPWSEPAFTEFTTAEARPLVGPPVTDTSYYAGECSAQERDVIVYWNDPMKYDLQGELTHFEVTEGQRTIDLRKGINFYKTSLDCNTTHVFMISSATQVGSSIQPSEIIVPKESDELPSVNDLTVKIEDHSSNVDKSVNITVTWKPGSLRDKNTTLIMYMCQETNVPFTCFNDFTTKEVNVMKSEVSLENIPSSTKLFGYSLRDDSGLKRGIQWINCVYTLIEPYKPKPVNVGNLTESLTISWTSSRCNRDTTVLILRYHLYICTEKIELLWHIDKLCSNTTVSSTESTFTAKDLQGGHPYYVYIQAESPAGVSRMSDPAIGIPTAGNSDFRGIIGISMGTIIGVIIFGVVVVSCFRCYVKSKKRMDLLVGGEHKIWENGGIPQPQSNKECGLDTASNSDSILPNKPVEPPSLPSEINIGLIGQDTADQIVQVNNISSEVTRNTHEPKKDTIKIETIVSHVFESMDEQKPQKSTLTDKNLDDYQSPNIFSQENIHQTSDQSSPYVKITNAHFGLDDSCSQVAVDEGYSSPNIEANSPTFSERILQNVLMEPKLNITQPTQNIFMVSNLPMSSQKTVVETKLAPISSVESAGPRQNVFKFTPSSSDIQNMFPEQAASFFDTDKLFKNNSQFDNNEFQLNSSIKTSDSLTSEESNSTSEVSTELSEILDDLSEERGSYQNSCRPVSPGYVTCVIDGEKQFDLTDNRLARDIVDLSQTSSDYKLDFQPSQNNGIIMLNLSTAQDGDQCIVDDYKSLDFIEKCQYACVQGGPGTSKDDSHCFGEGEVNILYLKNMDTEYVRQAFIHDDNSIQI